MLEVEIVGPIHPPSLIVEGRRQPQLDGRSVLETVNRQEEGASEFRTVRSESVDLVGRITALTAAWTIAVAEIAPFGSSSTLTTEYRGRRTWRSRRFGSTMRTRTQEAACSSSEPACGKRAKSAG